MKTLKKPSCFHSGPPHIGGNSYGYSIGLTMNYLQCELHASYLADITGAFKMLAYGYYDWGRSGGWRTWRSVVFRRMSG